MIGFVLSLISVSAGITLFVLIRIDRVAYNLRGLATGLVALPIAFLIVDRLP